MGAADTFATPGLTNFFVIFLGFLGLLPPVPPVFLFTGGFFPPPPPVTLDTVFKFVLGSV